MDGPKSPSSGGTSSKMVVPSKLFKRLGNEPAPDVEGTNSLSPRSRSKKVPPSTVMLVIPRVLRESIDYLRDQPMVEGLFRIPGDTLKVDEMIAAFDAPNADERLEILHELKPASHDVATMVKRYLIKRGEPLVPNEYREELVKIVKEGRENGMDIQLVAYEVVVRALDIEAESRKCLGYVLRYLSVVGKDEDTTKMSTQALATVFAPIIMKCEDENPKELAKKMRDYITVTEILIHNSSELVLH